MTAATPVRPSELHMPIQRTRAEYPVEWIRPTLAPDAGAAVAWLFQYAVTRQTKP